jgi:hypothetical protein
LELVVDSNGVEALCRFLIVRPSVGHVPNGLYELERGA